jgi:hypothetical protein
MALNARRATSQTSVDNRTFQTARRAVEIGAHGRRSCRTPSERGHVSDAEPLEAPDPQFGASEPSVPGQLTLVVPGPAAVCVERLLPSLIRLIDVSRVERMSCEVAWFAALCDVDYEFLGQADPALQSSWRH